MPRSPPAPGRFSTMTGELSASLSRCAVKRAMKSEPPPGANGTMICTGFAGYFCACAENATNALVLKTSASNFLDACMVMFPWLVRESRPGIRVRAVIIAEKYYAPTAESRSASHMITIENLVKTFGPKRAVDGISFSVERGEVLGFLGPNGAGKSTTMRMITGFMPPTAGKVTVGGYDVTESPIEAKRLIGYLPENAASYPDMTVQSFLEF